MLCPNVGLRGDTMSKNCRYCGAELPDNAGFCPKCGKQTQAEILPAQEQKHCQSCGAVLPSGARFCPKCRTATNAEQTVPYSGQPIAPFPVQNNAQPVLSAPMQKGIQQKQVSVWSRVFTVFLVVLLLAQTLIALFVRPGWLKHKSGSVTVSSEGIDLSALSESAYLVGLGDKAGNSSEFTETPVVSSETLAVPADGSAVTAECDAVIELGAHNALTVPELTVVKHEPDNESLPGGTRSYYEISAGEVHEFDYYFDIRLPYDPETADPENIEGSVFAEYLNEETNKWELIACDLDTEKNEVIIHTNHLSHFTPVTVKNSSEIYPLISTYEHYYVSDTAAANELKMILGKEINEFKEDPFVQDLFFYMFSTIGDGIIMNDPTGLFTAEDYAQFYKFSDKKDFIGSGTFKDTVDWLTTIAGDALPYIDMFNGTLNAGSASITPSGIVGAFAFMSNCFSAAALMEQALEEQRSGKFTDKDGIFVPDKATVGSMYKMLAQYYYGEILSLLGVSISFLYTFPVFLVDYGLDKLREYIKDATDTAMAVALYNYYLEYYNRPFLQESEQPYVSDITGEILRNKGVKMESWETLLLRMQKINNEKYKGDPDQLRAMFNSKLSSDLYKACDMLLESTNSGNNETAVSKNGNLTGLVHWREISEDDRQAVCEKAQKLLIEGIVKAGVIDRVANQIRSDMRQQATDSATAVREGMDLRHSFIVEEIIPDGKESEYAGCRIEFIADTVVQDSEGGFKPEQYVAWQGVLDKNGGIAFSFSTMGYILSGLPKRLKVYDKDTNEAVIDITFEVRETTTRISLGQQNYSGHWELVNTYIDCPSDTTPRDPSAYDINGRYWKYNASPGKFSAELRNDNTKRNNGIENGYYAESDALPSILVPRNTYPLNIKLWLVDAYAVTLNISLIADPVIKDNKLDEKNKQITSTKISIPQNTYQYETKLQNIPIPDNSECPNGELAVVYSMLYSGTSMSTISVYKWVDGIGD